MTQIGRRIRELREQRGFSQGDVERITGMLRAYISRVEHGHTVPSLDSIERFAGALGVPLHEMFRAAHTGTKTSTENAFLTLLSGYVSRMGVADRDVLMRLAHRLAQENPKVGQPTKDRLRPR